MKSLLKKITNTKAGLNTYSVGLLQAKAFRILKSHTRIYLADFDITTVDWAFLGLLYEHPRGMRLNEVAEKMGVKAPFITRMLTDLEKKKTIALRADPEDARAKLVMLTTEGRTFVSKVESGLRKHVRMLLKGAGVRDLIGYITVLQHIIENTPIGSDTLPDDPYSF